MNVHEICEKIKKSAVRDECWTCECFQGFVTQLMIDLEVEDPLELEQLSKDKSLLHSCLGCDPCPPGNLFQEYLKNI